MLRNSEDWSRYRRAAQSAPLLTADRERELLEGAQHNDRAARDELIRCHMRLVVEIAARHARRGLSAHDLIAEGVVGLMEAVKRYDLSHDTRFSSYAMWWVRACIRQFALANRRIVGMPSTRGARRAQSRLREAERALQQSLGRTATRDELAQAIGVHEADIESVEAALSAWDVSLSQLEPGGQPWSSDPSPEWLVAEAEERKLRSRCVEAGLKSLTQRERRLVCEQYCEDEGQTLSDLGRELGVSRQRAGQILAVAREKLRSSLSQVA